MILKEKDPIISFKTINLLNNKHLQSRGGRPHASCWGSRVYL